MVQATASVKVLEVPTGVKAAKHQAGSRVLSSMVKSPRLLILFYQSLLLKA